MGRMIAGLDVVYIVERRTRGRPERGLQIDPEPRQVVLRGVSLSDLAFRLHSLGAYGVEGVPEGVYSFGIRVWLLVD
jgi:hypothetical protein